MSGKPLVYAHRGGRVWAPENTLAAFTKSLQAGVAGIELDVHRCKTGELMVTHHANLSVTSNGSGFIFDKTFHELRQLSFGLHFGQEFADERIPTLAEVLSLVNGKAVVNVEIKTFPRAYANIERDVVRELDLYSHPDKVVISCFDYAALQRLHKLAPRYRTQMLICGIPEDMAKTARSLGISGINPEHTVFRRDNVLEAHAAGFDVNVWTVNGEDDWRAAWQLGVDVVMTDDPAGCMAFYATLPDAHRNDVVAPKESRIRKFLRGLAPTA